LSLFVCAFSQAKGETTVTRSISASDLVEYENLAEPVQRLIDIAVNLSSRKLTYTFGSNSPGSGGMDCSGTVQYSLQQLGLEKVPRSSYDMYHWVLASGEMTKTPGLSSTDDPVLAKLQPGQLIFWQGTYKTKDRDPPVSHVMIYLGTLKADGRGVTFGASDGRRYRGTTCYGVSVFDWEMPRPDSSSKIIGYGPIPTLAIPSAVAIKVESKPKDPLKALLENLLKPGNN
jgi:hypothetical protein